LVLVPEDVVSPEQTQLSLASATYLVKRTGTVATTTSTSAILARDAALLHIINCGHANAMLIVRLTAIAAPTTTLYA
jgi:hypothetical protein